MKRVYVTTTEVTQVTDIRYKDYIWQDGLAEPAGWANWTADEQYEWVNENCVFDSDHADEIDCEVISEVASEVKKVCKYSLYENDLEVAI